MIDRRLADLHRLYNRLYNGLHNINATLYSIEPLDYVSTAVDNCIRRQPQAWLRPAGFNGSTYLSF
jgi:hypothetical protein